MKITAKIESVTPTQARKWLDHMIPNRKPKDATVAMYANDMLNGKWVISPQGIAFNHEGQLIDGQNRLLAVIRSGITVPMLTLRGFPAQQKSVKTMDILDAGAGRTIGDRLRLMGAYSNPNLISAIARQIAQAIMGNNRAARKLSISQVVEISALWKQEARAVCTVLDRPTFRPARNGYTAAAFIIAAAADLAKLDKDMGRFITGAGLDTGSPLLELRNQLFTGTEDYDKRHRTNLCLSAIYSEWHGISGRAFTKPETIEDAITWFGTTQPKRFTAVQSLFHTPK